MKTIIIGFICGFLKIPKTHKKEVQHDKVKIQNFYLNITFNIQKYLLLILFYKLFPMLVTSIFAIF